jgi:DNA polymerase-3 subunit delta
MITTLCGENDAMRLREQTRIVTTFEAEYTDMGLERLDAEETGYDRLVEAVQSLPFLVSRKLVVIRSGSLNTEFTEKFEQFLGAITDSTDVLLVEGKLDKRTAYYKQLKKLTDFHEFAVLDASGLTRFAADYAKEWGGTLSTADARFLVERIGTDQMTLTHELDKLLTYNPHITRDSIVLLTEAVPQSKIFDLLDAAFAGEVKRTQTLYADQRAQGVEPQQIVAMLVWQLYVLAVTKAGQQRSVAEIASAAKLNPYVVEKTARLGRRLPPQKLRQMITDLRVLDVRSKSESIILDDALQQYLLAIGR